MNLKGKILQGKNIHLRTLEKQDSKSLAKWHSDPEIMSLAAFTAIHTKQYWSSWLEQKLSSPDALYFGIVKSADNRLIGQIHLEQMNWPHRLCREVGLIIGEKGEWSKGYGTEALELLIKYAFEELGLHRLELMTFDFNRRGIRVWEKCGFRLEGAMRSARLSGGEWRDLLFYALLEDEYRGRD
jgi:RimJ/RimL family protein N-acetyltransferase